MCMCVYVSMYVCVFMCACVCMCVPVTEQFVKRSDCKALVGERQVGHENGLFLIPQTRGLYKRINMVSAVLKV